MTISETANAISSLIRTLLGGLLIGAIGYGGGWLYTNFNPDVRWRQAEHELQQTKNSLTAAHQQLANQNRLIEQLAQDLEASQRRIVQLDTSLRLMKVNYRVAEITVTQQDNDPQTGELVTRFLFQEVDEAGTPIDSPRTFQIIGDMLYVDYWIVKFDDQFIEQAELERSTSICLFRRLLGNIRNLTRDTRLTKSAAVLGLTGAAV